MSAAEPAAVRLPVGVRVVPLTPHADDRGVFTEIHRANWGVPTPVQWNVVHSRPGTLRGVHVHLRHWDYLVVVAGQCVFGLCDLRSGSATRRLATTITLGGEQPSALVLPPGVAHGFYFPVASTHVYGVTHYWDLADELGCRFDDPELGIAWPTHDVRLSPRDRSLPSLRELLALLAMQADVTA